MQIEKFYTGSESFISFQRLYELHTGLDCSEYLSQILTLDMLILNTDRHFNNLGIIVDREAGICGTASIFDNGNSLLSDWERFHKDTLEGNMELVYGQPFSSSPEAQAECAGIGLAIEYDRIEKELEKENDSRGVQVLRYQLTRYRKIIPELKK